MSTRLVLSIFSCLVLSFSFAQRGQTYFIHKVKAGETYKSIAGKYDLSAKELASYNNLDYYGGPLSAKTLRIPKKTNSKKDDTLSKNDKQVAQEEKRVEESAATLTEQRVSPNPKVSSNTPTPESTTAETTVIDKPGEANKNLPAILSIVGGVGLLAIAIIYYRFVTRK